MRIAISLIMALALVVCGAQAEPVALVGTAGTGNHRSDFTGTLGQVFKTGVGQTPTVAALGFYDENYDGFATTHQVGLWQSGNLLVASTTLQAGTASRLYGNFRYEPIAPVTLLPDTYYIVASTVASGSGQDRFRDHNAQLPSWGSYFVGTQATDTRASRWGYGFVEPGNQGNLNSAYGPANLLSQAPAAPTSLVGYWNFDDPADPQKDLSGNGHPVLFAGNAARTESTSARGAGSVRVDGSGDWVQTEGVHTSFPGQKATLSFWTKIDVATPSDGSKTGFANTGGSGTTSHHPWTDGLGYYGIFRADDRANSVNLAAATRTQWHHMAITTEPGTGTYHVYQNGQPVRQQAPGTFLFNNASAIGSSSGGAFDMQGYVDEFALYNEARTVSQVRSEYVLGVERQQLARVISLADIVGGGNGYGTGASQGINPTNGQAATGHTSGNYTTDNAYHTVPSNPFVDGVFIPDGGAGAVQITSTGLTVTLPDTNGLSWDSIWNGPNVGVTNNTLNTVDFSSPQHQMIGFHINKGITFDLDAIRQATPDLELLRFMTAVGSTSGASNFQVYLDGVQQLNVGGLGYIELPVQQYNRFLTITAINGGWTLMGDPQLIGQVPEPATMLLLLTGLPALAGRLRRRVAG